MVDGKIRKNNPRLIELKKQLKAVRVSIMLIQRNNTYPVTLPLIRGFTIRVTAEGELNFLCFACIQIKGIVRLHRGQ